MKYLRSYPWGMQLFLFLMMIVAMIGFCSTMLLMLLPKFTTYSLTQLTGITELSPVSMIQTSLTVQGISSLFIFLIPAWLFAYLAHPNPPEYLGLRKPGRNIQFLLVIGIMAGAIPLLQALESLISLINFGPKIKASQAANDHIMNAYMNVPDFVSFIKVLVILAVVPALGEELFFRGVMMRFVKKRTRTMVIPVLFTAAVFSYAHTNIYGFLSIFIAGIMLAVIYYLTHSLWCGILGHFFFNGSQVILSYLGKSNATIKAFAESSTVPVYFVLAGAVVFGISFYLLWKNKTPLADNWTDDFPPEGPFED